MVATPKISWYFLNRETETYELANQENFLGSFLTTDTFCLKIRLWNNRWGVEPCKNIENGQLLIQFLNIEDASLLNYLNITLDGIQATNVVIKDTKAYVPFNKTLSGIVNNGTDNYIDNYIDIVITIQKKLLIKTDLKSMILDIVYY